MQYIIFDVETTGLYKNDEVIQFSAMVLDEHMRLTRVVNFYSETQVPISPQAYNTHRLTKAKLHDLSEQVVFEDNWLTFVESLRGQQVVWIDWSVGGFDERLVNQTLTNNGLEDYFHFPRYKNIEQCSRDMLSTFDLMGFISQKYGRTKMRLSEAAKALPYSKMQLEYAYDKIVSKFPNIDIETKYHNSLYDTFITWLLFKQHIGALFNE